MEASVTLDRNMRFIGSSDTQFEVVMDASPAVGGEDTGLRPMELILIGLCGCTAMDVVSILRKKRQDVRGLQVKAAAERSGAHPKVFTAINLEYIITGKDIDPNAVERAIQLSADPYCPAQAMLGKVAELSYSFTIQEEG